MMKIKWFAFLSFFLLPLSGLSVLDLELTRGVDRAIAITITPFSGQENTPPLTAISTIMRHDLSYSGRFKTVDMRADYAVSGQVRSLGGDTFEVSFVLRSAAGKETPLLSKTFKVKPQTLRSLAHHISDIVYQHLTGDRGIFSTRIAYILVNRYPGKPAQYRLEIADADGYQPRTLLVSSQPIMSPNWSPDGKKIAYVSFENGESEIDLVDIVSGQRRRLTRFPGINGAPAWSPDGQMLALVLSKEGSPQIYTYHLGSQALRALTQGRFINTEPSFSADGRFILFTSDRGGAPQIYRLTLGSGQITRMTFKGQYNARGSFTPNGQAMIMLHRADNHFNIALQDLRTGSVRELTHGGNNTSPSVAPNGKMVLYTTRYQGRRVLGMVSTDNKVALRLPSGEGGEVQGPAWSPF